MNLLDIFQRKARMPALAAKMGAEAD